jgi:hypothetical protein
MRWYWTIIRTQRSPDNFIGNKLDLKGIGERRLQEGKFIENWSANAQIQGTIPVRVLSITAAARPRLVLWRELPMQFMHISHMTMALLLHENVLGHLQILANPMLITRLHDSRTVTTQS